jgi:hypothetical protein
MRNCPDCGPKAPVVVSRAGESCALCGTWLRRNDHVLSDDE